MNYLKYTEKLESITFYIANDIAVNTRTLSLKLNVSKRTILRMIEHLRLCGAKISYCKKSKRYFLEK
jgi:predicted DNA-binding transcriptional regulator YafY